MLPIKFMFFIKYREGVGCRSIPDTDVASEDFETMNLQLFIVKERPKLAGANSPGMLLYFKVLFDLFFVLLCSKIIFSCRVSHCSTKGG